MSKVQIASQLLAWFEKDQRRLPWRENRHWYFVWVSEVMLQQTQVSQVVPYFNRFIDRFPTVHDLANASQEEVLKLWEGLGYYSRARNMHRASRVIITEYNGELPHDIKQVLNLPGFGPYISHAVLSLAFNLPFAVVDGNVKRVIARLFAVKDDLRLTTTHRNIQVLADKLLHLKQPGVFNEALMELGALICLPVSPACNRCPVMVFCQANIQGITAQIPYKSVAKKVPQVESIAIIMRSGKKYLVGKRPQDEMLAGMWEFPVVRLTAEMRADHINEVFLFKRFRIKAKQIKSWPGIKHAYTHFKLTLYPRFFEVFNGKIKDTFYDELRWLTLEQIKSLPMHKVVWKILNHVDFESEIVSK